MAKTETTDPRIEALKKAWAVAGSKDVLFLVAHGREFLVEGPEFRLDGYCCPTCNGAREAVLRLFADYEDAVLYCELQREDHDACEEEMQVVRTTLTHLWGLLDSIERNSVIDNDAVVRVDLCVMNKGDVECIDSIFALTSTIH